MGGGMSQGVSVGTFRGRVRALKGKEKRGVEVNAFVCIFESVNFRNLTNMYRTYFCRLLIPSFMALCGLTLASCRNSSAPLAVDMVSTEDVLADSATHEPLLIGQDTVFCVRLSSVSDMGGSVYAKHDSVVCVMASSYGDTTTCVFVYPRTGRKEVDTSILHSVSDAVGGSYAGPYRSGLTLARHYALENMKTIMEGMADVRDISYEQGSCEYFVSPEYETSRMFNLTVSYYTYMGGVHGMHGIGGLIIRSSDGKRMELSDLLRSDYDRKKWQQLIRRGLREYFGCQTDEELRESLQVEDFSTIPMPQMSPYFTEEGLVVSYQPYEIACYAAGVPSFVIPQHELLPFLSAEGLGLLR